jgi:uncharacterized protein YjiS (DUF1127 family)
MRSLWREWVNQHVEQNMRGIAGPEDRRRHRAHLALEVRRERRMLLSLDDRVLRDIGLSRCEAWAEAHRSLWDIPHDRLLL